MTVRTCGILLAAGQSLRFGIDDKLQADFQGQPLFLGAWTALKEAGCELIFAAVHTLNNQLADHLKRLGAHIVAVDEPQRGRGHSLSLAMAEVSKHGPDRLVVHLADMPLVPASHMRALLKGLEERSALVSESGGVEMPPFALRGSHTNLFQGADGERGGRAILRTIGDLGRMPLDPSFTRDIDTQTDLHAMGAEGVAR